MVVVVVVVDYLEKAFAPSKLYLLFVFRILFTFYSPAIVFACTCDAEQEGGRLRDFPAFGISAPVCRRTYMTEFCGRSAKDKVHLSFRQKKLSPPANNNCFK